MYQKFTKSQKRKVTAENQSDEEFKLSNPKKKRSYSISSEQDQKEIVFPKTIGRPNEMYKHQQTLSCRVMAYNKSQTGETEPQEVMVVVVTNYQGATQAETVQSEVSIKGQVEYGETDIGVLEDNLSKMREITKTLLVRQRAEDVCHDV